MRLINRHKDINQITSRAELFGAFIETSPEGFFIFDAQLYSIEMNHAALKLAGVDHSQTTGTSIRELLPNMDSGDRLRSIERVISTDTPYRYRDYIDHGKTGVGLYEIVVFKLGPGVGVITYNVSEIRDKVTQLASDDQMSQAVRAVMQDPFLILDSANRVLDVNKAFLKHFRLKESEVVEYSLYELADKQWNIPELHELLDHMLSSQGTVNDYEFSGYFKILGQRTLRINARQFYHETEFRLLTFLSISDITDVAKHRESVKKLADIFFKSPDPILLTDLRGDIIDLNDEAIQLYGWQRGELLEKPFKSLMPPETRNQYESLLQTVVAAQQVRNLETEHWSKRGDVLPINLTVSLLQDLNGENIGTVCYVRHIASLSKAEKAMKRLQEILLLSNDPVVIMDLNGIITDINNSAEVTYGWPKGSIKGKSGTTLVAPEDINLYQTYFKDSLAGKTVRNQSLHPLTKQGVTRNAQVSFFLLTDSKDESNGVAVVAKHTSALEKAERSQKRLLKSILELSDPVIIENLAGEIVDLNEAAAETYGWKRVDLIGKLAKSLIPVETQKQGIELVKKCLAGETVKDVPSKRWSKTGVYYAVNLTMFMVQDTEELPQYIVTISQHPGQLASSGIGSAGSEIETIFSEASDPIMVESMNGYVTRMNKAAEKMFGWSSKDLIEKPMRTIIPADQHKLHDKILLLCQNDVPIQKVESKRWSKTGQVYAVNVSLVLLKDDAGKATGIAHLIQDITEVAKLRQRMQQLEKRLGSF